MKKIYITSLHLQHGGVEMAITLLANALVKRGYAVEILCIYHLGEPVYEMDDRVKVTYLSNVHPNREEFKDALAQHNICRIIREGIYAMKVLYLKKNLMVKKFREIDEGVIISTRNEHSVLLSKYGQNNVKKIAQLHHDHNFNRRLLEDFRNHYKNIDIFVLLTDLLKQEVENVMKENKHTKCVVIPNFLKDELYKKSENSNGRPQIVTVGRLHEVKGFQRLIKTWKEMDFKDDVVLKIIGEGEEREELEKLIAEYHLEGRVVLTGAMNHDSVMSEMQKSILYVMTSYSEAFPFVLIEAMANGLPIVAYDVRVGPGAIIKDSLTGFLVPDGDEEEFRNRVELLVEDTELRKKMSDSALERSKLFMENTVMEKWLDILEEQE